MSDRKRRRSASKTTNPTAEPPSGSNDEVIVVGVVGKRKRVEVNQAESNDSRLSGLVDSIADCWLCPITLELPVDPVTAEDGRIYERSDIEEWLREKKTSPSTNEPMGPRLLPAKQAKATIEALVRSGAVADDKAEAWKAKLKAEQEALSKKLADKENVRKLGEAAGGGDGAEDEVEVVEGPLLEGRKEEGGKVRPSTVDERGGKGKREEKMVTLKTIYEGLQKDRYIKPDIEMCHIRKKLRNEMKHNKDCGYKHTLKELWEWDSWDDPELPFIYRVITDGKLRTSWRPSIEESEVEGSEEAGWSPKEGEGVLVNWKGVHYGGLVQEVYGKGKGKYKQRWLVHFHEDSTEAEVRFKDS
eukprot:CAMPEP_0197548786 /NCGR_PEP_ID=MMETSP1320-20131121/2826_1 /TAXON_ID=91990 /ORGANISM="Bolidomonas sp., Strain RCC2347" /LENGTH=357 /DNA_ID=CAMNT_0043108871 /DNA_START=9 /DNA_END=1078 /DNA_ORIENTATION=+